MSRRMSRRELLQIMGTSSLAAGLGAALGHESAVVNGEVIQPQRKLSLLDSTDVLVVGGFTKPEGNEWHIPYGALVPKKVAPRFNHVRNPEFEPYVHEHLFPNASHDDAWGRFLEALRTLVKSYGDDKIVVLNSGIGDPWQSAGDCCMWESFIFSWAWEGRRHTWSDVKAKAKANQWYLNAGRRIVALAFLDPKRHDMKNDSFWAFACARLVDFVLWANLDHTEVQFLNRVHLGPALGPCQEAEQIAHRFFENGLIVLNDSLEDREVTLRVADDFVPAQLLDLYEGKKVVQSDKGTLKVRVPGKMARILVKQTSGRP